MMMTASKPLIGISLAYYDVHNPVENKYHVKEAYVEAIKKCGGIPILLPIMDKEDLLNVLSQIHGVLLTGGGGLLPHVKKMARLPSLLKQNPVRHQFDRLLADLALEKGLPLMGICRGHQVINESLGGTIYENLDEVTEEEHAQKTSADQPSHPIRIEQDSLLYACFGEHVMVNSFHRQAIKEVGAGLKVTATSPAGVIEAIEGTEETFILGLQFHPEFQLPVDERYGYPYQRFIQAAKNFFEKRGTNYS